MKQRSTPASPAVQQQHCTPLHRPAHLNPWRFEVFSCKQHWQQRSLTIKAGWVGQSLPAELLLLFDSLQLLSYFVTALPLPRCPASPGLLSRLRPLHGRLQHWMAAEGTSARTAWPAAEEETIGKGLTCRHVHCLAMVQCSFCRAAIECANHLALSSYHSRWNQDPHVIILSNMGLSYTCHVCASSAEIGRKMQAPTILRAFMAAGESPPTSNHTMQ